MTLEPEAERICPLTAQDLERLAQDRHFLAAAANFMDQKFTGSLEQLQQLHDQGPFTEAPENEAVALGTGLGDLLASELGLEWVRVSDELGVDLALRWPGTSVVLFPRDMVLKRDRLDFVPFFEELCREVRRLIQSGEAV